MSTGLPARFSPDQYQRGGGAPVASWDQIAADLPAVAATMRAYLGQIAVVLRPGSVHNTDQCLRAFATYLLTHHPEVTCVRNVGRAHIEGYKPWLASRPGRAGAPLAKATTLAHRLGTLRMFFLRIDEWAWDDAPTRVPMFPGDVPKQHHPLPKALDDQAAARLLAAARTDKRRLVGLTVEFLLRTGLRVGEYTALAADAVVLIGSTHWLHVPVGKLHEDRYLPLHPDLLHLISAYRDAHVPPDHPLLLPRENGKALDRHTVTRFINKAGAAAGLGHIHPHQLRHTLATQAINRGMSLEAIAAMLGHKSLDMTLVYAKIANRTVANEYFAVAEQVDALYARPAQLPADALGPNMARLSREHSRLLGNGYCTRPKVMDCVYESICESCTFFQTTIAFRPTLHAQRDDACAKGQVARARIYDNLLTGLDNHEAS